MSETDEAESFSYSETEESEVSKENENLSSASSITDDTEQTPVPVNANEMSAETSKMTLPADHPLMLKYQEDLKERLQKLLLETDEQLLDLKRTITAQEKEIDHFTKQGYEFQKALLIQEDKLVNINQQYDEQSRKKLEFAEKNKVIKQNFEKVDENLQIKRKTDIDYQKKLEDMAFQVVQLTSLKEETFTDAKSLQRAVEKSSKDRENIEVQKLRQDLLIFRLENDIYNFQDKINLYKTQWAIKKEEVVDLRKELNAAHTEMELINYEKQQIVHQWRQSLASLEKQDKILSEIRNSVRSFDDDLQTLNMEVTAHKKSVRKEFERNEILTVNLQFQESNIARSERDLKDAGERENSLTEHLSVIEKLIAITENELKFLNDSKILNEKELEAKEREILKCYSTQRSLEEKHMGILHEKITITKASKYTEKLIKDIRNSISSYNKKGSLKEGEKEKLLLQVDNSKTYVSRLEENLEELQKECKQQGYLLDKCEANVVKTREKTDAKRNDCKNLENELQQIIARAGGQELAPYERELANLRKEVNVAEQGKRDMEQGYIRFQRELFSLSKLNSVVSEENDMYKKKIIIIEGKKLRIEADIAKEEKDVKDTQNRILCVEKDTAHINKLINERKELHEGTKQSFELTKSDFIQTLKEAEMNFLQKQAELNYLRKRKRKFFSKVMEIQKYILFWEQKVHLVEETCHILKSDSHLNELFQIKSKIRQLQLKQEQIKKEQENLVQEMGKAVYRHTSLYVEADKQALYGKRRKTPEYVKKRIKNNMKKISAAKKALGNYTKQIESLKTIESGLEEALVSENSLISEMRLKINSIECNTDCKQQEKCQAVLKLSFKQKKNKMFEKLKDGTYIRAIRNDVRRPEEIMKIQNVLRSIQVIVQATMNEYPSIVKNLSKAFDYIIVSKEF